MFAVTIKRPQGIHPPECPEQESASDTFFVAFYEFDTNLIACFGNSTPVLPVAAGLRFHGYSVEKPGGRQ